MGFSIIAYPQIVFKQSEAPEGVEGRFWIDTDDGEMYFYNGSSWVSMSPSAGLELIQTITVSSEVTEIDFDSVNIADYNYFKIIGYHTQSSETSTKLRINNVSDNVYEDDDAHQGGSNSQSTEDDMNISGGSGVSTTRMTSEITIISGDATHKTVMTSIGVGQTSTYIYNGCCRAAIGAAVSSVQLRGKFTTGNYKIYGYN